VDNTTFYILHTKIHGNYPTLPQWENLFYWRHFMLRRCRHTKMWKKLMKLGDHDRTASVV
jgi:hypothetical protein